MKRLIASFGFGLCLLPAFAMAQEESPVEEPAAEAVSAPEGEEAVEAPAPEAAKPAEVPATTEAAKAPAEASEPGCLSLLLPWNWFK